MQTKDVLIRKINDLLPDVPVESGMLLLDSIIGVDRKDWTLCYQISPTQFSGMGIVRLEDGKSLNVIDFFHIDLTNNRWDIDLGYDDQRKSTGAYIAFSFLSVLFIHFFETEKVVTVQPAANSKFYSRTTLNGEHYDSNLTYPINVIDAHWYTTIVREDPFLVRGHFRRQPYGPGRGQYKIRWITAFMKKGYTRQARHESKVETNNITQ